MRSRPNLPALFVLLLTAPLTYALDTAPDFTLAGIDAQVKLAEQKGKVVYLDFWASWCVPCRKSFPWMNQLKEHYGPQGLEIIAINLDKEREPTDAFLAATAPTFTIAFDPQGQSAESYQVMGMPSSYLIDRNGMLHHSHIGFRDKDKRALESQIEELLQQ